MRRRLPALLVLVVLGALIASVPAAASAHDVRAKKKVTCSLKKKAKCKKAKLKGLKVGKQNLTGANLAGATITGATFTGTNLTGVDLSNAKLTNVTFKNVKLGGATLAGARLVNVKMDHVDASAGASARASSCQIQINSNEETFCSKAGLSADGVAMVDTTISYADFPRSSWRNAKFTNTRFLSPDLTGAEFTGAVFQQGSAIMGLNITDSQSTSPDIIWAWVSYARFDRTTGLRLAWAKGEDPSFFGASDAVITNSSLDRPRGRSGARTISVGPAAGSAIAVTSIKIAETGFWRIGNLCAGSSTCTYAAAVGMPVEVIVTSATSVFLTAPGWTCSQSTANGAVVSKCSTDALAAGGDFAITYGPVSPPTKKVTVNLTGATAGRIAVQTLSGTGAVTDSKECLAVSTCTQDVVAGSIVSIAFTVSDPSGDWLVVQLPGGVLDTSPSPLPVTSWSTQSFVVNDDTTVSALIS